jgi:hypothetical protein
VKQAVELGQVIAERRLILDPDGTVTVRIGLPITRPGPPEESWCPYQIEGLGAGKVRRAVGIDAIQSLWLALVAVGSALYASEEYQAGRLHSFPGDPDLGLPVFDGLRDLVPPTPPRPEGHQDPQ